MAEALFSELAVDGFFLEYDDERSGGFAPLRFVPPGKMVVLGLVTTKRGELESKDDLKRRIDEAAKYVPLDQLCLSPQCGFSSTVEGNALTYDEQVAKLRLDRRDRRRGLGLAVLPMLPGRARVPASSWAVRSATRRRPRSGTGRTPRCGRRRVRSWRHLLVASDPGPSGPVRGARLRKWKRWRSCSTNAYAS